MSPYEHSRRMIANQTDHTYRQGDPLERSEPFRLFGISNFVWLTASGLAGVAWLALLAQGY